MVNIEAYEALPAPYKALMQEGRTLGYKALIDAHEVADKKNLADWEKRGLVAIKYTDAELKKLADMGALPVWESWVKEAESKGVPGRQLLDAVLAETDKAKKALGK